MAKLNYQKLVNSLDFANYVIINHNIKITKISMDDDTFGFTTLEIDMPN